MDAPAPPTPPTTTEREPLSVGEIRDVWPLLAHGDRIEGFLLLPRDEAEDFFFSLSARDQADIVCGMPGREQRSWVRLLPPDDAVLSAALGKFFRERNIRPADDLIPYLLRRIERSIPKARAFVATLDETADAEQRPISRALARRILENQAAAGDLFD